MSNITIIDSIGWHNDHIAVFSGDELFSLIKIQATDKQAEVKKLRASFGNKKIIELKCSPYYREFVSVSDFPKSLKEYFLN